MTIALLIGLSLQRHGGLVQGFTGHGAVDGLDEGMIG